MQERLWGSGRDLAALFLRLAIVGYAVLVIGFRHLDRFPPVGAHVGSPEVAFWLVMAVLTLLPLVYAFWLTWRSLFGSALLLATFATFEVIAVLGENLDSYDPGDLLSNWPVEIGVRLALLAVLWGATLLFSRAERAPESRWRDPADWRIVVAMLLAFALPELETFRSTVIFYDVWSEAVWPSWLLLCVGALGTGLAAWVLRESGLALGAASAGWALAAMWALCVALFAVLFTVILAVWALGFWLPRHLAFVWPGFELLLMVALVGPLLEEWTWRGVLWAGIRKHFSALTAIVLTSAGFGLIHLMAGPVEAMPQQFLWGLLLGWLRWRTGRLWPCVLAHMLGNAILISLY